MADTLNYASGGESNDYKWTEIAFDLMTDGKLSVALIGPEGSQVNASGSCPRCNHDVDYSFDETIIVPQGYGGTLGVDTFNPAPGAGGPSDDGEIGSVHYVTVPVLCQCSGEHPGRPDASRGCGIVFNTELRAQ